MTRPNRKIPPDDVLTDLFVNKGKTSRQMADMYNASRKTVDKHVRRLGLSQNQIILEPLTYGVVNYIANKTDTSASEIIKTVFDVLLDKHIDEVERALGV